MRRADYKTREWRLQGSDMAEAWELRNGFSRSDSQSIRFTSTLHLAVPDVITQLELRGCKWITQGRDLVEVGAVSLIRRRGVSGQAGAGSRVAPIVASRQSS
jgi:hypothetical protein